MAHIQMTFEFLESEAASIGSCGGHAFNLGCCLVIALTLPSYASGQVSSSGTPMSVRSMQELLAESKPTFDPAFAPFVDLALLTDAWGNLDSQALTDVALQVAHGEFTLRRQHASIPSDVLFVLAADVAAQHNDKAALQRLAVAARSYGKVELSARIGVQQKLASAGRSVQMPLSVSALEMTPQMFARSKECLQRIERARLTRDREALQMLDQEILGRNELSDEMQLRLRKIISDTLAVMPEEGDAGSQVRRLVARLPQSPPSTSNNVPVFDFEIVNVFPHNPESFCQGLVFADDGTLYEGTGRYGRSSIRKVDLLTGRAVRVRSLSDSLFGEGIAIIGSRVFQLTWKSHTGFVYDRNSFRQLKRFRYGWEGWGLTYDGQSLIFSDGSSKLRFVNPHSFRVKRTIDVQLQGRKIDRLNELEYVNGAILANVWGQDHILRISPESGDVTAIINLDQLFPELMRPHRNAVLNGIAHDPKNDRLFVTGKDWPNLYEIRLVPPS